MSDKPALVGQVNSKLIWSAEMITEFWDFLSNVRKVGAIGAISISLHVADRHASGSVVEKTHPLLQCSHIKIWHDAELALYVRTVLNAWKFACIDPANSDGAARTTKIKPLNKAKLVLLDESITGVMIC